MDVRRLYSVYSMLCPLDGLDVDAVLEHLPERAHLPQPPHLPHRPGHRVVHLLLRRETTDAKSENTVMFGCARSIVYKG